MLGVTGHPVVALTGDVRRALEAVADPTKAGPMAAYLKGHFVFLGVQQPARRTATTPLLRAFATQHDEQTVLDAATALWNEQEREFAYVAADLLAAGVKHLTPTALPALEALLRHRAWWDGVDALTGAAVNPLASRHEAARTSMERWATDADSFWVRRSAIIHQLGWKDRLDRPRLARIVEANAADPEFFIRKAIGWALRDASRAHPDWVRSFVQEHRTTLSPLSVREATKHL